MRSPAWLLESYDESAREAAEFAGLALANGNVALALQDWSQQSKSHFFRALVAWRTGLIDPVPDLKATVDVSDSAVAFFPSTDSDPLRMAFDSVPGAYAAVILGDADRPIVNELAHIAVPRVPRNVPPDTPLEAWLVRALTGADPTKGRALALALGRQKRLGLLATIFTTYFDLADVNRADSRQAQAQTRRALELFGRKRRDGFYAGGIQYEGGDEYNDVVIDFHLAAIWRVRGWDPSGLTDEERRHVVIPA
jgi:hypothetical protein